MAKLLLVDGSNLLFQMFYGMPARISGPDGRAIHGTLGFIGALLKIIRMTCPTHIAILFDGEYTSDRAQLDENYKANRTDFSQMPEEDTPFSQLPDIYAALDHLNFPHAETTICETDDWIAGYASLWNDELVIVSQDSDYFQLISHQTNVLRYRGKQTTLCDPEFIHQRFGIEPKQYAYFKSLTGDPSDNIRGAEKVGPKTAAALLNEFGTLEEILLHAEQIKKPAVRASILKDIPRLRRNYELIHLTGNSPLPFPLSRLSCCIPNCSTTEVLHAIGLR